MKLRVLLSNVAFAVVIGLWPGNSVCASSARTDAAPEQMEIHVSAAQAPSTMNHLDRLVHHLGGTILSRNDANGRAERLIRIPADNVQYFRENAGGPSARSASVRAREDQVFQVVVLTQ